jgi:tetratricopeptide (TPR) repeat protein
MLLNFRPEYQAPWMGKSYYHQLPLAPLGPDAIRELIDALLGRHPSTAGLAEAIHARTGGNPFFTEEVVQNLIESGKLQGSKGAYRLVTPVDKLELASSVHALLAARIDRLAEREKDVLQTAAVIGREFDEPTLAAVVEQAAPQLREALQKLKDAEFVYEQSLYPIAEYLFKHPLTQEVALASQLQERRKRLHAAVARVVEAAHAHDLDQQAALLAHHWEEAADLGQAVRWHRRAAEWVGTRDPVEGLRHWRKVRDLGHTLNDADAKEARLRACSVILASGTWRLGMSEDVRRACLEAVEIAEAVGSRFSQVMASSQLATAFFLNGDYGACEERLTEALAQARGAGTGLDWQAHYLAVFADSCLARGDAEAAIAKAREGIEAADVGGPGFKRPSPRRAGRRPRPCRCAGT